MKKVTTVLAALVATIVCSCLVSSVSYADCGKMMIYRYPWRRQVQPPPQPSKKVIVINVIQGPGSNSNINLNVNELINNPQLPPPPATLIPRDCPPPATKPIPYNEYSTVNNNQVGQFDNSVNQVGQFDNSVNQVNDHSPNISNNRGTVNFVENNIDNNGIAGFGTFKESGQRAGIAWNGYEDERGEETLILTTNEVSATGQDMAMLSVLPLPGAPLDISEADPEIFNKTRDLLYSKLPSDATAGFGRVVFNRKIGAHNIFVWELDDIDAFKREVTAYVAKTYNNEAAALIDSRTEKIVGEYFKRGFRYFAFDLTLVKDKPANKVAIAYRFKSSRVYFPLQISQVGAASSKTTVDLIVMSPGKIVTTGAVVTGNRREDAVVTGHTSVDFTMDEVEGLNPELAKVFGNRLNSVKVREYIFRGDLNGYNNDFTCRNYNE